MERFEPGTATQNLHLGLPSPGGFWSETLLWPLRMAARAPAKACGLLRPPMALPARSPGERGLGNRLTLRVEARELAERCDPALRSSGLSGGMDTRLLPASGSGVWLVRRVLDIVSCE